LHAVRTPAPIAKLDDQPAASSPRLDALAAAHDEPQTKEDDHRTRRVYSYLEPSKLRWAAACGVVPLIGGGGFLAFCQMPWAILASIGAFCAGLYVFRHRGSLRCSACEGRLARAAGGTCPRCGGTVVEQVRDRADALDKDRAPPPRTRAARRPPAHPADM